MRYSGAFAEERNGLSAATFTALSSESAVMSVKLPMTSLDSAYGPSVTTLLVRCLLPDLSPSPSRIWALNVSFQAIHCPYRACISSGELLTAGGFLGK